MSLLRRRMMIAMNGGIDMAKNWELLADITTGDAVDSIEVATGNRDELLIIVEGCIDESSNYDNGQVLLNFMNESNSISNISGINGGISKSTSYIVFKIEIVCDKILSFVRQGQYSLLINDNARFSINSISSEYEKIILSITYNCKFKIGTHVFVYGR